MVFKCLEFILKAMGINEVFKKCTSEEKCYSFHVAKELEDGEKYQRQEINWESLVVTLLIQPHQSPSWFHSSHRDVLPRSLIHEGFFLFPLLEVLPAPSLMISAA